MLNKLIANILPFFPRKVIWMFSKKYIAGENIDDAIRVSKMLNSKNTLVTIDLLGEQIYKIEDANKYKEEYLKLIEIFENNKIKGNYSLKPTMFGLHIDSKKCYTLISEIINKAADYNNFVRIDMEDSSITSKEIDLFVALKNNYPNNVGLVFQANLKRSYTDISNLLYLKNGSNDLNFRLCKGIYIEPKEISYRGKRDINQNFIELLEHLFINDIYVAIATHDKKIIKQSIQLIEKYKVKDDRYEFQMLYGVTPELRNHVLKQGYKMRVYVPYGKEWFHYSTRRLKENPKFVYDIMKSIFIRN